MKIYIDSEFCCHTANSDGAFRECDVTFFSGKCETFVEGYRYIPSGESWTREDGTIFHGEMISPWKSWSELDDAQREYERQQLTEARAIIAELDVALLDTTYNSLLTEVE